MPRIADAAANVRPHITADASLGAARYPAGCRRQASGSSGRSAYPSDPAPVAGRWAEKLILPNVEDRPFHPTCANGSG